MIEWIVIILLFNVLVLHYKIFKTNQSLQKDLHRARTDLDKLKLLNKMCVDWDGNLIKGVDYRETNL